MKTEEAPAQSVLKVAYELFWVSGSDSLHKKWSSIQKAAVGPDERQPTSVTCTWDSGFRTSPQNVLRPGSAGRQLSPRESRLEVLCNESAVGG